METEYQKNFKALQAMRKEELINIEKEIKRLIEENEKKNHKEILSLHEIAKKLRMLIYLSYI